MSDAESDLLKTAQSRSAARRLNEIVLDYEQMAELFRRFTRLDSESAGPELARLQSFACTAAPQPMTLRGKISGLLMRMVSPVIGRVLRAASLASPFQAAYDLALRLQEQQLESERRILDKIAAIEAKIEILDSKIRSRSFSP
jgi:hypothetical protein